MNFHTLAKKHPNASGHVKKEREWTAPCKSSFNVKINDLDYHVEWTKSGKSYIEVNANDDSLVEGETHIYIETSSICKITHTIKIGSAGQIFDIARYGEPEKLLKRVYIEVNSPREKL